MPEAGIEESDDVDTGTKKLMKWCENEFNKEITDEVNKTLKAKVDRYCFGAVSTIKGKLTAGGVENWLETKDSSNKDDEQFKYIFAIYKYNDSFKEWLSIQDTEKPSTGFQKLKKKCREELQKKINDSSGVNYQYLSWWCTKTEPKTVEERIKEQNPSWTKETADSQWPIIFENWRNTDQVLKALKKVGVNFRSLTSNSKGSSGKDAVKTWCEKGLKKKVHEDDVYLDEYKRLMSVCKSGQTKQS